ncbi:MAG: hypothetical protein R6V19_16850 [Armatimonadota bacterium]
MQMSYNRLHRRSTIGVPGCVAAILALLVAGSSALAQQVDLTLDDVHFLSERRLHVKGSVHAQGLMWPWEIQNDETVSCRLWVAADFMRPDGSWNVLPDEFRGKSPDVQARDSYGPDSVGVYTDNKKHAEGTPWLNIPLRPLIIFEKELDEPGPGNPGDEGRTFTFDETLEFPTAIRIPDEYRIVARLERSTSCYGIPVRFWNFFTYAVWGPNPWGTGTPPATPITGISPLGVNGPTAQANPDIWKQLHGSTGFADTGGTADTGGVTTPGNQGQQAPTDPQTAQAAIQQTLAADASLSNIQVQVTAGETLITTAPPANTSPGQWPNKIAEIATIAAENASFTKQIRISFVGQGQQLEATILQADATRYANDSIDLQTFMGTWKVKSATTADDTPEPGGADTATEGPINTDRQGQPAAGGQPDDQEAGDTTAQPPTIPNVPATPGTDQSAAERASMARDALQNDCAEVLGLRNVQADLTENSVQITAVAPELPARGLWSPIIAYALADASLLAPWTDTLSITFTQSGADNFSVQVARADADAYVNGTTGFKQFMQKWQVDGASPPEMTGQPSTPGGTSTGPTQGDSGGIEAGAIATDILLSPERLPQGWQSSQPVEFSATDILAAVAPGSAASTLPVESSAMQTIQVGDRAYTVVAMVAPSSADAQTSLATLRNQPGGTGSPGLIEVSQDPPVRGMALGRAVYLVCGSGPHVAQIGGLIGMSYSGGATEPQTPQVPQIPATPQTPQTPTQPQPQPQDQGPQPMELDPTSVVKEAIICEGVDEHNDPVGIKQLFPTETKKVTLFLRIAGAPQNTEVTLEWSRNDRVLTRRLLILAGDQRLDVPIFPARAEYLPSGNYAVEIKEGERVVGRRVFTIAE